MKVREILRQVRELEEDRLDFQESIRKLRGEGFSVTHDTKKWLADVRKDERRSVKSLLSSYEHADKTLEMLLERDVQFTSELGSEY